jgi:hypothetical protein
LFAKNHYIGTEWCVYMSFVQKSNVENQRENMVLLLANISTRTAAQEGHPLVSSMLLGRHCLRQFFYISSNVYAKVTTPLKWVFGRASSPSPRA